MASLAEGFQEQTALLRRSPALRKLLLSRLASECGSWMAAIAMSLAVFDLTHSTVWVSLLMIGSFLPQIFGGALGGPLIDRVLRRRLLVGSDLINAGLFLLLALLPQTPTALVAVALASGCASALFRPTVYAALPNMVDRESLPEANSLFGAAESFGNFLAPALGGLLAALFGVRLVYVVNAGSFLLSALLLIGIAAASFQAELKLKGIGHWAEIRSGLRAIREHADVWAVACTWIPLASFLSLINVTEVVLVKQSMRGGDFGYGLLVSLALGGVVVGSILSSSLIRARGPRPVYLLSFVGLSLGLLGFSMSPSVWTAALPAALLGIANGIALPAIGNMIQGSLPDDLRGRVFATMGSAIMTATVIGMAGAGVLSVAVGTRGTFALSALAALVAGLAALLLFRASPSAEIALRVEADPSPDDEISGLLPSTPSAN